MPRASFEQASFLGGEWSPYAGGRIDQPNYKTALGTCLNGLPIEEGPWCRRSGTAEFGITHGGYSGCVREFILPDGSSGVLEFTFDSGFNVANLRIWVKGSFATNVALGNAYNVCLVGAEAAGIITSISTDSPAVLTMAGAQTWDTGDTIIIGVDPTVAVTNAPTLRNRQFGITKLTTTTFTLTDIFTNTNVDGSLLGISSLGTSYAGRVKVLALPYTSLAAVQKIKVTQHDKIMYIFAPGFTTQKLTMTPTYSGLTLTGVSFALTAIDYGATDGPYLDPPGGTSQTSTSLAYVVKGADYLHLTFVITDAGYAFVAGDVGRGIRIWSQPAPYVSGSGYVIGNVVSYNGALWRAVIAEATAAATPGSSVSDSSGKVWYPWAPAPQQGVWMVGKITAVTNGTTATILLNGSEPITAAIIEYNGSFDARNSSYYTDGGATPGNTTGAMIDTYRIGSYGNGIFPTCGGFQGGRVWLGGALTNQFDASISGTAADVGQDANLFVFAPTDPFGAVLDVSAISYTLSGTEQNQIQWFVPDVQGILAGTNGREFLITGSAAGEVITPTSIQVHPVTQFRSSPTQPIRVGQATIFVQKDQRKVFEYLASVFGAGRFTGKHLNEFAKHLTSYGLFDLVYTEELAPVLWTFNYDGELLGCTYRRVSNFPTEPPLFNGWHRHTLGHGRHVISMCHASDLIGSPEGPALMTFDTVVGKCFVEMVTQLFDEGSPLTAAWYVDGAMPPSTGVAGTDNPTNAPPTSPYSPAVNWQGTNGKFYFEITVGNFSSGGPKGRSFQFGVGNSSTDLTMEFGLDANSAAKGFINGTDHIAGSAATGVWTGIDTGTVYGVAVDTVLNKLWFQDWNSLGVAHGWIPAGSDPSTGAGGYDIAGIAGELYILFGAGAHPGPDDATLNTGGSAFTGTMPTGFAAWDAGGSTAWDVSRKGTVSRADHIDPGLVTTTAIAASNGNLTATVTTTQDDIAASSWYSAEVIAPMTKDSAYDGVEISAILIAVLGATTGLGPWGSGSWHLNAVGIRSNTFKNRS